MDQPKTMKGKLALLIKVCNLTSEGVGETEEENELINDCVAQVQNELSRHLEILEKYKLEWNG